MPPLEMDQNQTSLVFTTINSLRVKAAAHETGYEWTVLKVTRRKNRTNIL